MRRATGMGPEWRLIWAGADPPWTVLHHCGAHSGPGDTELSAAWALPYTPTPTPGVESARCERCRTAWVRTGTRCADAPTEEASGNTGALRLHVP